MKKKFLYSIFILSLLSSCSLTGNGKQGDINGVTPVQENLKLQGWEFNDSERGLFEESMGVKPIYGLHDSYSDIAVEPGFSVAIKIVSLEEHKCYRYVFVPEAQTVKVNEFLQGKYYL